MSNYLSRNQQERLTRLLGKGVPMRTIAHGLDLDEKTVARHQIWLGRTAIALVAQQGGFSFEFIQMDEFYSYILAHRKNASKILSLVDFAGQALQFLAIDSLSGFIANYLVAPSNDADATRLFLRDFDSRLARHADGSYIVQPEVITDGHTPYWNVIKDDYPTWRYGRFNKLSTYQTRDGRILKRRMFAGIRRENLTNNVSNPDGFNTQKVEGVNGSARALNMRVHKESKAFSKRLFQHECQLALWIWYYNRHLINERTGLTPAMLAGVDDTLWDAARLIKATEEFREQWRVADEEAGRKLLAGFSLEEPCDPALAKFWLYRSLAQRTVKVHKPDCRHSNRGEGVAGLFGARGTWLPFLTLEGALAYGDRLEPRNASVCRHCISHEYHVLGRRL